MPGVSKCLTRAGIADKRLAPVRTKFSPPRSRRRWVERPHLNSQFNEGRQKRLTLISAPAGFGKTTLAAQWVGLHPGESAWISLDQYDDQLEGFVRYLAAALGTLVPKFGAEMDSYLSAQTLPPPDYLADVLIAEISRVRKPILLALDDYHTIHSSDIHSFVTRLLERAPEHFHLLVLTRADPPWPLARWRVSEWVNEFRASDLRFNLEETRTFFNRAGSPLAPDLIAKMHELSEGWIASLQLLRLSLGADRGAKEIAERTKGESLVLDYLMEEVLSRQPPEIRKFLAVSSLLDRFCAPLCDRMLAGGKRTPDSRRMIARLERDNQFLVPLDRKREWYRYHHLFRGLLVEQLHLEESPKHLAQLNSLAGKWFAEQGLIEEALRHLLAAGEFSRAGELVEENMHDMMDRDVWRRELGRWLELFPSSERERFPSLLIAGAHVAITRWDTKTALPLLARAEELLRDPAGAPTEDRRRSLEGTIAAQRALIGFWSGDAKAALQYSLAAQQLVPRPHGFACTLAAVSAAGGYSLLGQRDRSLQVLADALADDCALGGRHAPRIYHARAVIHYFDGALADTVTHAHQILELVNPTKYYVGYAHHLAALAEYERNNLEAAADHLSHLEALRYQTNVRAYHDGLFGLALVAVAQGDADRAGACAASARAFATEVRDAYSLAMSDSFEARLAFLLGKRQSAPPPLVNVVHSNKFYFELPPLTLAEYWLADPSTANCRSALEVIEDGLRNAERHHHAYQTIQFLAVKALALWFSDCREDALEILSRSLDLAKPRGFVRTFVDRGPEMLALLEEAAAQKPDNDYVQSLLDAFSGKKSSSAVPHGATRTNPLSNRETDVLLMLANRLSNKEIAGRLFVSAETVKKHTISIYRKLEVHSRYGAVAVARSLDLVPPTDSSER